METKIRYVLKHIETGLYWSHIAQHTRKLFEAWRFSDAEKAQVWMAHSMYAPDEPELYGLVKIEMMIEEVEVYEQSTAFSENP